MSPFGSFWTTVWCHRLELFERRFDVHRSLNNIIYIFSAEHVDYIILLGALTLLLALVLIIFLIRQRGREQNDPANQKPEWDVEAANQDRPPSYSRMHSELFCLKLEDHLEPPPPYCTTVHSATWSQYCANYTHQSHRVYTSQLSADSLLQADVLKTNHS